MKLSPCSIILSCVALAGLLLLSRLIFAGAADHTAAVVAQYGNAQGNDGIRASALLAEHKIQSAMVGSAGLEIVINQGDRADEARQILARAIKDEGLKIQLVKYDAKTNRLLPLSAETVLGTGTQSFKTPEA